jgi:hypothetical protein
MGQLTQTFTEIQNMVDRNMMPFKQDVAGTNSIAIEASTPTRFAVNGLARNVSEGPAYMTDRWDTVSNKMTAITEYDSPVYVANLSFIWTPDASSAGDFVVRLYIDDTTPKLISTYSASYKGAVAIPKNILATWYWGSEAGYDAKNDGIYFEVEFEHAGDLTSPALTIYNTQ